MDEVDAESLAYYEAEPLLSKAKDLAMERRFAAAIGTLEAFDRGASNDKARQRWAKEIEKTIDKYDQLASEAEREAALADADRKALEAKLAYDKGIRDKRERTIRALEAASNESQIGNDLFNWTKPNHQPTGSWKVVNEGGTRMLVGEAPGGEILPGSNIASFIGTGKPAWQDLQVEFQYKIDKGGMVFIFHTAGDSGPPWATLEPGFKADATWRSMKLRIVHLEDADGLPVDGSQSSTFKEAEEWQKFEGGSWVDLPCADYKDSRLGGIGFAIQPGSKVSIKDLKVRHLDRK
jgi:hypothetical protein